MRLERNVLKRVEKKERKGSEEKSCDGVKLIFEIASRFGAVQISLHSSKC